MSEFRRIIKTLDLIRPMEIVWPRGLVHDGGPHRRMLGMFSPISIGEDECKLFKILVQRFQPKTGIIIGNAFGLSSACIATYMKMNGGKSLIALDSEEEGDGKLCASIAERLRMQLKLKLLQSVKGRSPEDLPKITDSKHYDLIFIDGSHHHPQPTRDYQGLKLYAHNRSLWVWHDYWIYGVSKSTERARADGYLIWWVPTSCEIVIATRHKGDFKQIKKLFPQGSSDPPTRSIIKYFFIPIPLIISTMSAALNKIKLLRN